MPSRVLIIEDEPDIRKTIDYNLSKESFEVVQAASIQEGERALASNKIDVIILDLMLPDGSGLTLCRDIKSDSKLKHIPVIILTAKTEEVDRVVGFELGADDYVTKPIKPKVLISKVKGLLRRFKEKEETQNILSFNQLIIDRDAYKIIKEGKELSLPRKEFELIFLLASKPGKVFEREKIMNRVWGGDIVGDRTIDVHIRKLREKIGDGFIKTIKGVGYKFITPQKIL